MPCESTPRSSVINVPLDYEMRLEDGLDATVAAAILHGQVDAAIASHSREQFEADCSKGILNVYPGYTDFIDTTAATCNLGGNCYPVQGYVKVQYDPDVLTAEAASTSVFSSIVSGMDNSFGRSDPSDDLIVNDLPADSGVRQLGVSATAMVGGVRSQIMSGDDVGGLTAGGKAGLSILGITAFALLAALAIRRRKRKKEWRESKEGEELALDEYNTSKVAMMNEIDDVVAGIDGEVLAPSATQDTADAASAAGESTASVDQPARFPVDDQGFPQSGRRETGEEGFEVSVC
mmetsp:Transcript_35109/g.76941  ORF Transcript_35109/g.76941 Transcript_35109/m.76941 type:complete len:291 (+) Transcript_35109:71-943(+)